MLREMNKKDKKKGVSVAFPPAACKLHHAHFFTPQQMAQSFDSPETLVALAAGLGATGIGCYVYSFFKYKVKLMQVEIAPTHQVSDCL